MEHQTKKGKKKPRKTQFLKTYLTKVLPPVYSKLMNQNPILRTPDKSKSLRFR